MSFYRKASFSFFFKCEFLYCEACFFPALDGTKAQLLFSNLKKKYLRKKREVKEASRSGTSSGMVSKVEKALQQYEFMRWLDGFVQAREGRSYLPTRVVESEETEAEKLQISNENGNENSNFINDENEEDLPEEMIENSEEIPIQPKPSKQQKVANDLSEVKKKRNAMSSAAKEALNGEIQMSILNTIQERFKKRDERKSHVIPEDSDDIFCKSLALDLKGLPHYEKCMAKQEIRNVLFKYQMSVMN